MSAAKFIQLTQNVTINVEHVEVVQRRMTREGLTLIFWLLGGEKLEVFESEVLKSARSRFGLT